MSKEAAKAVNHELEVWLGMHANGPIELIEWGLQVGVLNH